MNRKKNNVRRLPDGFCEGDVANPAYAEPLARAVVPLAVHCRELLTAIGKSDFDGGLHLDCTKNGAYAWLGDFFEALAEYEEGRVPFAEAEEVMTLTRALIEAEKRRYPKLGEEVQRISQAFEASHALWGRRMPRPMRPREAYLKLLFDSRERIYTAICDFNAKLFRPDVRSTVPCPAQKSTRRRYTDAVEREIVAFVECAEFDTGRERNGRTCYEVERAAAAWVQRKHPRDRPQTKAAFLQAYRAIRRHRRK